ncbi:MAG: conjugal transfer protein TraE [Clostridiales bacterium]|nr:conjugal transfer protein TraE [Clostridiales bacterium]
MSKNKQQKAQEKRLERNVRQVKKNRAETKKADRKPAAVSKKPSPKGGFFARLKADAPQTAQQSIPYREMYRDGICRLSDRLYSKTVQFFDINYQLAQAEDKSQIFESYCDFLNYFDSSIHVQLTFINQRANMQDFSRSIEIPPRGDEHDDLRREYADMLKGQLQKGNNGLAKRKYITFSIEADDLRTAKMRLERIEADVLANFKTLGVQAQSLNGIERLELLHSQLHPDGQEKLHFDWSDLPKTGLSTKDYIAPSGFSFSNDGKTFRVGDHFGAVSFVQITAPELSDRLLADLLELNDGVTINLHIQSIDQAQAIKNIKRKMSDLQKMTIEEQKKAVRAGYDMDIIPTDLTTYGEEAKNLLQDLQSRNEHMFLVTALIEHTSPKRQKLLNDIFAAAGIIQKYNCALKRLDWQQEQGLMSSLTLGQNQIEIERSLTTSSTAIFVPFTTCELFQSGEALYYGLNALSNNLIMANRKMLKNPNGLFLGTPGSGKSFSAKREIENVFLLTDDDIIIADPENEYGPLVNRFGAQGQVTDISPNSQNFINPMDINLDYSDDENPVTLKSDFILSLCDLIVGGKEGLSPIERTIIDRCTRLVYRNYLQDPRPENMPILGDLYELLRAQSEPEAQNIATALEIYVNGSLNVFNHRSNIQMDNHRVLCFQLKSLGKALKEIGLLIMQDAVWNRVTANRSKHKTTWFYIDEFHLLLKGQTGAFSVEIWKRFRKWGGIPSGLTQNVKDLLASREIENIFENSDFIYMLNQAAGDRQILAKQLGISSHQLSFVTHSGPGEGLLFFGNVIIPFVDHFPKDSNLYRIMTTRPDEIAEGAT